MDSITNPSYGEYVRHFNVRIETHIRISPLTKKRVKSKGNDVINHLLLCNKLPRFESFGVLTKENRKFVLKNLY